MIRKFKNITHGFEAYLAKFLSGRPSRKIQIIGVTGTDGKTTTASLIFHILKTAGYKCAMITTIGAQIGDKSYETGLHTTTPSSFSLQRYIKKAVSAGCDYLVLEITSHALDQNRSSGVNFKIGVLTNITHEHLDYHGTYEKYVAAKSRLFKKSEFSILNRDDESFKLLKKSAFKNIKTYSTREQADFTVHNIGIKMPEQFGFNIENFLAAVSVTKLLKIPDDKIKLALSTFKFPQGRQEIVYDRNFRVIIDFAHTPNSFRQVLPELKKSTKGRLIHVFGAAGQRDRSKRSLMGEIASEFDDVIFLTAEDPRSEIISDINEQIKLGMKDFKGELIEIDDRQEAINFAVRAATKGDTVVLTGKGHEKSMNLGKSEIPWSEHDAVEKALGIRN